MLCRYAPRAATVILCAARTPAVARVNLLHPATTRLPLAHSASATFIAPSIQARHSSSESNNPNAKAPSSFQGALHVLQPPWQLKDLRPFERQAYEEHGPGFYAHLSKNRQRKSMEGLEKRAADEREYKPMLGEDWYAILKEGNRRFHKETKSPMPAVQRSKEAFAEKHGKADGHGRKWSFDEEVSRIRGNEKPRKEEIYREVLEEREAASARSAEVST